MVEEDKEAPVDGPALLLESEQVWSVGREGGRERQRRERVEAVGLLQSQVPVST